MHQYIEDLIHVIRNCAMDNTYKMAWARSLVEHSVFHPKQKEIHFDELAPLIFKYYWNQSIFFRLEQGPNPHKRPKIHQIVKDKIDEYQRQHGTQPVLFDRVTDKVDLQPGQVSTVLKLDVCHRFQTLNRKEYAFYSLHKAQRKLNLHRPDLLKRYADVLFELINYRWSQKLEDFNSAPRISQKVRGVDRETIRRKTLTSFRAFLDVENPDRLSFITNLPIDTSNLSIDHAIPWSYMYSDDLWNLVYVEKSQNSSKSNRIPTEKQIEKLEERNKKLLTLLDARGVHSKHVEELRLAIERDFVRKFYVGFKG